MEKDFLKKNSIIKIQKVFRGFLTRKSLRNQKKIKKARKRNNLIRELIETEKSYLFYLKQTNDYFLSPLLRKKILDEEKCQLLFSNINSIFVLNYQLYEDLKSRQYDAKIHYYGDIFLNFIPYLKIYSEYVNNYPKSIDILKKARKKNKFSKFIKKVEELPQLNRLELESLLIAPIQRLPRYVLFIEEIVKNTSKNHPDFKYFQQALVKIKEVADQVNIKKREQENLEQLLEIRPFIRGFEVVSKNRKIIKQGDIIISYKNNQRQKRKCLLFNDCLIIMQRNWDHNFTFEIKVSFEQIQIIGNEDKSLILVNGANKIWMFFPDMKTKNGWESAIKETLINFQKSKLDTAKWNLLPGYGSIPPKMMNHRACIVDDSIYVFGGENSHHEKMNDLFRYQLDSYEWNLIEIKEGNKPSKRIGHTLNKIQDNLFLFGGEGKENKSLGDLHIFRIETKKWINSPKVIGVAASERSFHSSSVLSGKIWIFGGIGKTKEKLNDLHQLDTTVNPLTWINVDISNPFFAIPRCGHSTVFLDNKLFIIGGEIEKEMKQSLIIYDLKSNSFFKIENEFLERSYHTITLIKDRIWIIGGENEQLKVVNIVVLNGKNFGMKEINEIGDFPGEFSRHTTVIKENSETQKLYLFGGLEKGSGKMSNKVYCLDAHFQTLIPNENTNLEEKVENFESKLISSEFLKSNEKKRTGGDHTISRRFTIGVTNFQRELKGKDEEDEKEKEKKKNKKKKKKWKTMEYFLDSRFGSAKEFANDFLGFVVQETEWGKSLPQTFRQKFIRPVCIVVIKYFNKTKESQYLYLQEKISLANLQKFLGCGAVYVYSGFNEKVIVDEDMFENLCFVGKKKYGVVEIYEL